VLHRTIEEIALIDVCGQRMAEETYMCCISQDSSRPLKVLVTVNLTLYFMLQNLPSEQHKSRYSWRTDNTK
jgi:hypothetical protein